MQTTSIMCLSDDMYGDRSDDDGSSKPDYVIITF